VAGTEIHVDLVNHEASTVGALIGKLCDVYADAYEVGAGAKVDGFRRRLERAVALPGFDLVTAHLGPELAGFVFGYTLGTGSHWWDGLEPEPGPDFAVEDGARTVVLSEIEVRHPLQRRGIGKRLEEVFLASRSEPRATLATGTDSASQVIYPEWGWTRLGTVPGNPGDYFSGYVLYVKDL
jgi:GNAT superfamily N-acetyltransferase